MTYSFNKEKNETLKKDRNISFEEIIELLENNNILADIDNPNFLNQKIFIVEYKEYIYAVPYIKNDNEIFLKTIYPSRKQKKKYKK